MKKNQDFYSLSAINIDGKEIPFEQFRNKTLLIVNVASKCTFTKQYIGLENLYQKFRARNFLILGFPCNQFGKQESGSEDEIKNFCVTQYNVTFPLFAKINVNGEKTHPLYVHLKNHCKGLLNSESIKWNFTKFLVDKNGEIIKRFAPITKPEDLAEEIEKIL